MISTTLMMGAGVFGIGFGIGFVWGELKASQDMRREQNSITSDKPENEKTL